MTPYAYEYGYGDEFRAGPPAGARFRMGIHDFTEHYGRYSGGPSYDYEYTERTITHPFRTPGPHGFTRRLRPTRSRGGRAIGPRPRPARRRPRPRYDRFFRRRFGAWYRR